MTKRYKLVNNVVVETNVVETPFGRNATTGARWEPGPTLPSFDFVPPQVGARALPVAASDDEVMPASNGTGLYFNTSQGQIRMWAGAYWLALFGGAPTKLPPGSDLSDLHGPGLYQASSPLNAPPFLDTTNLYISDLDYMQFCVSMLDPSKTIYVRSYSLGYWGPWGSIDKSENFTTAVNLNDIPFQVSGTYTVSAGNSQNVPNDPGFNNNNLILEVYTAGGQVLQRLTDAYSYGTIYQRSLNDQGGTSWKPWFKFQGAQV